MTTNLKSKTDHKTIITIGFLSLIYILNWVRLFYNESYLTLFQSSHNADDYDLNTFIQNIFLFALPISIYLLHTKNKISFNIIMFYLSFQILWELAEVLKFHYFFHSIYASHLFHSPISLIIISLIIICFCYMLFNKLSSGLGIRVVENSLSFSTALILVLINYLFFTKLLFLLLTLLLFILVSIWDFRLYKNKNLEAELGISKSEFFKLKRSTTILPFLVLIPYILFIERVLLGPSHMLSDHMWSNSYHIPNKYYDFTMYLFLSLPAIIAYLWFYIKSKTKLYLTQFAVNYYFTIVLNYLLLAILFFVFSLFSLFQN